MLCSSSSVCSLHSGWSRSLQQLVQQQLPCSSSNHSSLLRPRLGQRLGRQLGQGQQQPQQGLREHHQQGQREQLRLLLLLQVPQQWMQNPCCYPQNVAAPLG